MAFMLREIKKIRQDSSHTRKRWFQNKTIDLFIWENRAGIIERFELIYDKDTVEKAVIWLPLKPLEHLSIDTGEYHTGHYKQAPMYTHTCAAEMKEIIDAFTRVSKSLEIKVCQFINIQLSNNIRHSL